MDIETSNAIERLNDRIDGVEVSLRAEIRDLRVEIREGLAANRRHTEVLFESLKDDIRIVAEGVAALTVRFDRRGL